MFCNRTVQIPGTDTYPSVPVFLCLYIGSTGFCHSSGISLSEPLTLERWLNSLKKGVFKVTASDDDGATITTDCNELEFTSIKVHHTGGDVTINFEDAEDCSPVNPCEPCENECLQWLVGLRDLCEPKDSSNCVWLNEIGISRNFIEQIITEDYENVSDFFDKQYTRAVNEVSNLIHNNFSTKYIVKSLIESQRLGFANDNKTLKAGNDKYAGIQVTFLNTDSYVDFYLSELSLFTNYTGTVTIKVYDLTTSKLLTSFNIDCIAGEQSYAFPNKIFKSNKKKLNLLICYDTTGISSYDTIIKPGLCCGKNFCANEYISASGNYSGSFIESDTARASHTFGMSIIYSLQCNHTDWICAHKNKLNIPIAYKFASNISDFGLKGSSDQRVNNLVTINREKLIEDQAWYENKFASTLENVLLHIETPSDRKCFQCRSLGGSFLNLP